MSDLHADEVVPGVRVNGQFYRHASIVVSHGGVVIPSITEIRYSHARSDWAKDRRRARLGRRVRWLRARMNRTVNAMTLHDTRSLWRRLVRAERAADQCPTYRVRRSKGRR